jgi:hypothetical protein
MGRMAHMKRHSRPWDPGTAPSAATGASNPTALPRVVRDWAKAFFSVALVAFLFSVSLYGLDVFLTGGGFLGASGLSRHYLAFDPGLITDALPALGMTIVAVLGIVLTVVAIIVQLSSDRYTGVALMFLRDPLNIGVMCFYVVSSLCALWLSVTLQENFVPRSMLVVVMALASMGLAIMLPYFAYVFWFLEPGNIVDRLRAYTSTLSQRGMTLRAGEQVDAMQGRVLTQIEEITDIANNSIDGRDKMITGRAVDALRDFLIDYIRTKPDEDLPWYRIGQPLRNSPNFVSMDAELLGELERGRLWVEWTALRQYLGIYNEALESMQEINSLVAIDTRYIGETAAGLNRTELVRMVFRFMNSYLRYAINHGNVGTTYSVLHQYRMLIETVLQLGQREAAMEGVAFLKYYGDLGAKKQLNFVAETVAYDIAALCRFAHHRGMAEEEDILRKFLDHDVIGNARGYRAERRLRGVRKAQVKLAAYYLSVGEEAKALRMAEDMRHEPATVLASIRDDLAGTTSPQFWEIVDRGRNFEYLPITERALLDVFFGWLEKAPRPACA